MFNALLVYPLFNLLAVIYALLPIHDFGLAVIVLTIVVRLLLWPLVTKQLKSQKAMQSLQPELQRIRTEAKGDKQLEGKLTMELYKEKEINPFASFLPLLIQLPIFFALFIVLRDVVKPGEIAHLAYEPVKALGPIADIIKHSHGFDPKFLGLVDLAKPSPLIALIAALAQFIQTKQIQPKGQAKDTQAQVLAGMTYFFPVITFVIGLSLPSALALYWTTTSAVAILQQYLVLHRGEKELEAVATNGKSARTANSMPDAKAVGAEEGEVVSSSALPAKSGKKKKKSKGAKA